jgi:hypothetical protein
MAIAVDTLATAQRLVDAALDGGYRVEVVGGTLTVTPGAGMPHNLLAADLLVWLRGRVPAPLLVVHEVDVSAEPSGAVREPYWRPDLVVTTGPTDPSREWLVPTEVVVTVEVVSSSNRDGGSGEGYLRARAEHSATHSIEWLLGLDGDTVTWWRHGQQVQEGPLWASGLRVTSGRVASEAR